MIPADLKEIAGRIGGRIAGDGNPVVSRVETDSRKDVSGALFVALRGASFDAHDFIGEVEKKGAAAVVTDHVCPAGIPQIVVADTTAALGLIGRMNRRRGRARVICVTGTCGKTTVKEMTAAILSRAGRTVSTPGNFNNAVGVPLSLLGIEAGTEYAVIELGANHPGEIAASVSLAEPDAVAVNNVGCAHLEGFGSLDGVYRAKSEILDYAAARGLPGAVNADNEFYGRWLEEYGGRMKLTAFSAGGRADAAYRAENVAAAGDGCFSFTLVTPAGEAPVSLRVPGRHNVANALCAAALAGMAGAGLAETAAGLSGTAPAPGRLSVEKLGEVTLIDDAYNASVNAVMASADTLALFGGRRIFILGDMGELGERAAELHARVGAYARGKADALLTAGPLAAEAARAFAPGHAESFATRGELEERLKEILAAGGPLTIAVKGAHFMHMEEVAGFVKSYCGGNKC